MEHAFQIIIHSCKNQTWQGVLGSADGDYHFHSELELLLEMARQLCPEGTELPPRAPEHP